MQHIQGQTQVPSQIHGETQAPHKISWAIRLPTKTREVWLAHPKYMGNVSSTKIMRDFDELHTQNRIHKIAHTIKQNLRKSKDIIIYGSIQNQRVDPTSTQNQWASETFIWASKRMWKFHGNQKNHAWFIRTSGTCNFLSKLHNQRNNNVMLSQMRDARRFQSHSWNLKRWEAELNPIFRTLQLSGTSTWTPCF